MNSTRVVLSAVLVVLHCSFSIAAPDRPPNIVLILADDFGVGDIQAHYPDNKIRTPHLDQLVRQGMSFTDAHSASAVCSPTRYGLLTGRYAWRTRLQEWVLASYEPPLIDAARLTLPGFLKQHGYHTACIGKWHLGLEWPGPQPSRMHEEPNALRLAEWDFSQRVRGGPTERGFDMYFGTDVPNYPPFTFIENDRVAPLPSARFQHDDARRLHLATAFDGAPMAPGWRFEEILPELTRRAVRHVHERAKQDAPFFLFFSMTSPHEPVAPSKDFAGKSGIAPIADFVMETDWSAGQVIKAIDDSGIAEDTIIIFAADNGHSHYTGWEQLVAAGHQPSGPYRGHKGDIWEGGHRVPFIVRWPGRVAADSLNDQLVCLNDVFATCAELLDEELPDDAAEDSFSFLPVLLREDASGLRSSLVSHSVDGEFAYRAGPWKIVFKMAGRDRDASRGKPTQVQLYHLDTDIAEEHDVARKRPEIVQRLTGGLKKLVDHGRSRPGAPRPNDTAVRIDVLQSERWAPAFMKAGRNIAEPSP
ncbi:MAG: arylsulfatase [Pirellulales bacterium]